MSLKLNVLAGLAVFSVMGLTACEETEADLIGDAQFCLDKATASTAQACLSKIEGIEAASAYTLRCAAGFLTEGFDDVARIVDSFEQLDSGGDGTAGMMSVLAFRSKASGPTNKTFAKEVNGYCQKSQQKGLSLLGTMALSATTFASIAFPGLDGSTTVNTADIETAINDLLNGTTGLTAQEEQEMAEDLGNAVVATYQTSCATGSQANTDLCAELDTAINSGGVDINDPASVADAIMNLWKN